MRRFQHRRCQIRCAYAALVVLSIPFFALHAVYSSSLGRPVLRPPGVLISSRGPPCSAARILVAHEQHLRPGGADQRLLSLLQTLRALGAQTSLLVRTSKCGLCVRSPPTAQLAALLGASSLEAQPLQAGRIPALPPAIYEFGGSRALLTLLRAASFDLVLAGLWFWYDPQPSFSELLAPVVAASRVPFALLSDDAHSERARRLSVEEPDPTQRAAYLTQARNFAARQRELYVEADGVFYLTGADRALESSLRVCCGHLIELGPSALPGHCVGATSRAWSRLHAVLLDCMHSRLHAVLGVASRGAAARRNFAETASARRAPSHDRLAQRDNSSPIGAHRHPTWRLWRRAHIAPHRFRGWRRHLYQSAGAAQVRARRLAVGSSRLALCAAAGCGQDPHRPPRWHAGTCWREQKRVWRWGWGLRMGMGDAVSGRRGELRHRGVGVPE